jgi:hypothetical protein
VGTVIAARIPGIVATWLINLGPLTGIETSTVSRVRNSHARMRIFAGAAAALGHSDAATSRHYAAGGPWARYRNTQVTSMIVEPRSM